MFGQLGVARSTPVVRQAGPTWYEGFNPPPTSASSSPLLGGGETEPAGPAVGRSFLSQLAAGLDQRNRYDAARPRHNQPDYTGLDYGAPPRRIPRLWRSAMQAMAGPRQWSSMQADYQQFLPVVYPTAPRRASSGAVAMAEHLYGDTLNLPAVFVGMQGGAK